MRRFVLIALIALACNQQSPTEPLLPVVPPPGPCVYVVGRITDFSNGRPIRDAKVSVFGQTTMSGSDGAYVLELGCPPRPNGTTWSMTVEHPRYETVVQLVTIPQFSYVLDFRMHRR